MARQVQLSSWALNAITCFLNKKEAEGNLIWTEQKTHTERRWQVEVKSGHWGDASTSQEMVSGGQEQILPWSLWRKHGPALSPTSAQWH